MSNLKENPCIDYLLSKSPVFAIMYDLSSRKDIN